MKVRKSKIVVSSILACFGFSLIGATFASWGVNDNAGSFTINISVSKKVVEQGYYLTFASDEYSAVAESAIKLNGDSSNKAFISNITISDGSEARFYYYDGYTKDKAASPIELVLGAEHGFASVGVDNSTITFDTERSGNLFSLYLNNDDELYIDDETYRDYDGYYIVYQEDDFAFETSNKLDSHDSGDNVASGSFALQANKGFKIQHFYGLRGIISTPNKQGANYAHFTNSSYEDELMNMKEAGTYKFMVSRNDSKVYIANEALSSQNGYYIVYSSSNYDYRSGLKMTDGGSSNLATATANITSGTTIKIVHVDAVNDSVGEPYEQGDEGKAYLSTPAGSTVMTFTESGEYNFYLNNEGKIYTTSSSYMTIYLNPGVWDVQDVNELFYAWVWQDGQGGRFVEMTASSQHSGYYEMTVQDAEHNMIFCRCSTAPTSGDDLNNTSIVWNKTADLNCNSNNCFTINGWSYGNWSTI